MVYALAHPHVTRTIHLYLYDGWLSSNWIIWFCDDPSKLLLHYHWHCHRCCRRSYLFVYSLLLLPFVCVNDVPTVNVFTFEYEQYKQCAHKIHQHMCCVCTLSTEHLAQQKKFSSKMSTHLYAAQSRNTPFKQKRLALFLVALLLLPIACFEVPKDLFSDFFAFFTLSLLHLPHSFTCSPFCCVFFAVAFYHEIACSGEIPMNSKLQNIC